MLDMSAITRVSRFSSQRIPKILSELICHRSYVSSISVPIAYGSKFLNFGSHIPPGQWIRSGCLVVNLKVYMLSSSIVIECSCGDNVWHGCNATNVRHFGYRHLGYGHLVIVQKIAHGNLTESIASTEP